MYGNGINSLDFEGESVRKISPFVGDFKRFLGI